MVFATKASPQAPPAISYGGIRVQRRNVNVGLGKPFGYFCVMSRSFLAVMRALR